MPPEAEIEPVTAVQAAKRLGKAPATIRCWAVRHNARQLRKVGRAMYYDLHDLAVIERETRHGHPVPETPEERAEISQRCPLRAAERLAAAA
jgi:hypothetical protein